MKPKLKTSWTVRPGDALLIIDVINDLNFRGGAQVLPWARKLAAQLARFRARVAGRIPIIYANDNFGHWRASFEDVYRHSTRPSARGREIGRKLKPAASDYFILKPRHSAFHATSLEPLLEDLGVRRLILSGIATNLCVLMTAHDAHMRRMPLMVLSDCCAAESDFDHDVALSHLQRFCDATICRSDDVRLSRLSRRSRTRTRR